MFSGDGSLLLAWLVATLHLIALVVGVVAILGRARALSAVEGDRDLPTVFRADNWWGVAAILWLGTGLWRAFGGLEKGTDYYLAQPLFHAKLGLFGLVFLMELWPMVTLIKWRRRRRSARAIDLTPARAMARVSYLQLLVVAVMLFIATAMARGIAAI